MASEFDTVTDIQSSYIETADGLDCLCRSHRGSSIKLKLFHLLSLPHTAVELTCDSPTTISLDGSEDIWSHVTHREFRMLSQTRISLQDVPEKTIV